MEGNPVASYIFRKKDQAVTMDTKSTIKIQDEYVHVDPQLLFHRLLTVGTKNGELQNVFDHELCHYPQLCSSVNAIQPSTISSLADALWCSEAEILPGPSETVQYVLDGGALLHRIPWTRRATYDQIFEQYSAYVRTIVVFDGYSDNPSTKECAHMRRSGGTIGVTVYFTSSMALQTKNKEFLSNKPNKHSFIALLSQRLEQAWCEIHQARGDADVLIVQTALTSAAKQDTVLVGDDTDLFVLLIYHAKNVRHNVLFRLETRRVSLKGNRCWNIPAIQALLGSVSLTTLCSCMSFMGVIPRLVFTVWSRNYKSQKIKSDNQFKEQAKVFKEPINMTSSLRVKHP